MLMERQSKSLKIAKLLREEACTHIEMSDMIAEDKELLDRLCRKV